MKAHTRGVSRLTTVFYRNFFLLIVVPLLLVIVVALSILRSMMLGSAYEKITLAQDKVVSTLTTDIENATLKLSHFLNSSNSRALELAAAIENSKGQKKYSNTTQLEELYNFAVTPSSDIIAIHFYGKTGEVQYLKDGLAIPLSELRAQRFYKEALADPDSTHVGSIASTITYMDKKTSGHSRMALVVAFAPQKSEPTERIEMVCMYSYTHVNVSIQEYSGDPAQGRMCLIDSDGSLLIPPKRGENDYQLPLEIYTSPPGTYRGGTGQGSLRYIVSLIPDTDWRLVSEVDRNILLQDFNRIAGMIIIASIVLFALFFGFSIIYLRNIIVPVNSLISGMQRVEQGDLSTRLEPSGQEELRTLTHSFNSMIRQTSTLMRTNEEQQKEKHHAEMQALQSQINPHFLVNTLGSIRFMAMVAKFDSIKKMAEALINILSASFRQSASSYTVGEEIEMLESYIYLMKIRYAENFEVEYEISGQCRSCKVPRLILQPIVENSIVHGFEDRTEMGHIRVTAQREAGIVVITVTDDGMGMTPEQVSAIMDGKTGSNGKNSSIGILNVHKRIQLNFGMEYGLAIDSAPGGTRTTISFPAVDASEQHDAQTAL